MKQQQKKASHTFTLVPADMLQRKCACGRPVVAGGECAECRKKRLSLQRRAVNQSRPGVAPPIVHEVLRSPGRPLDPATRTFMESHFQREFSRVQVKSSALQASENSLLMNQPGDKFEREAEQMANYVSRKTDIEPFANQKEVDFNSVRIHTDPKAAASARFANAHAYTVGNNIIFGATKYAPETTKGRSLIAHELTHVVQQGAAELTTNGPRIVQRLVDAARVSCESYPRSYPIFTAIGTDDPVGVLVEADQRAIEILNNVINELTNIRDRVIAGEPPAWPLIGDVVGVSMRDRLRIDANDAAVWTGTGPGTVEHIIRWFTNVHDLLTSGRISYTCLDPDCDPDDWAAAIPGNRRIFLCRPFWNDTIDPVNGRALTLIHEAAHLYYGLEDSGGGPGSAHCLENFVADLNNITIHPDFAGSCRAPGP